MMNTRLKLSILVLLLSFSIKSVGQSDTLKLTLDEAIEIARGNSLDAMIAENVYSASYWGYKNYQSSSLPSLTLFTRPFTYNRAISKHFNPSEQIFNYYEEQNLNSYLELSVDQSLPFSGGKVYINTDLGRLTNFGNTDDAQYSATAVRIGLFQPIFGFNPFKWNNRIQPVIYRKNRKHYIQSNVEIALKAIHHFFNCARSELRHTIAVTNLKNADSLHQIGLKRFDLASITKGDLLSLKLELINKKNDLKQARINYEKSVNELYIFLDLDKESSIKPVIPGLAPVLNLQANEVLETARENNPDYLEFYQQELEADREVERAKIASRFDASLNASYGLNQRSNQFNRLYNNMLDQERLDVTIEIPIVDWGVKQSRYKLAQKERDAQMFSIQQQVNDLEQDILMTVAEYNLQDDMVISAKEAADIATDVYNISMQRFILGELSVNDLILQSNRKDLALQNFINELQAHWELYYRIQLISLYDFNSHTILSGDFESIGIE